MPSRNAVRATLLFAGAALLPTASLAQETTLTVFAAASLTEPFTALGASFEGSHPGIRVRFNFAGSQQLVLQLQQGAKADLFASADERWMQTARDSGLVDGEPAIFVRNRLVVVVPRMNPAAINRLQDLARVGVKLVVAADAVPIGRYTRQMLARLSAMPGFGKGYAAQVLSNVVSYEENVKGIVAKVELGEADAGVVYRSDATGPSATRVMSISIPDGANVIAQYPIAIVHMSSQQELARAFLDLVESAEGQAQLEKGGFVPVGPTAGVTAP
jgi:molybdate transport system substrate-binding protein